MSLKNGVLSIDTGLKVKLDWDIPTIFLPNKGKVILLKYSVLIYIF